MTAPARLPGGRPAVDYSQAPLITIWETTRACDLACIHCRASAQTLPDPAQLTQEDGYRLLDAVRRFGRSLFVMTGGDPLKRPDIADLFAYAMDRGLVTALSPSGTPLLTRDRLEPMVRAGLRTVSISVDGSTAAIHDAFRGVPGSFGWSTAGIRVAKELGLEVQINTTVSRYNLDDLPAVADLATRVGASRWSVFFLVPTGRGQASDMVSAPEGERVLNWLYDLSRTAPFHVKTTEAQHYRRVAIEREAAEQGISPAEVLERSRTAGGRFAPGVNSGNGFLFISHRGDILPSGFLPLSAGNVKEDDLVRVYREDPVFKRLRDPSQLHGRCATCPYRVVCGGSRSRAYATTGDYLAEDPACPFEPRAGGAALAA